MFEETNSLATEARLSCSDLAVCTYIKNRLLRRYCIIELLRKVFSFRRDENDLSTGALVTEKLNMLRVTCNLTKHAFQHCTLSE